jgi:hypothetical protein
VDEARDRCYKHFKQFQRHLAKITFFENSFRNYFCAQIALFLLFTRNPILRLRNLQLQR